MAIFIVTVVYNAKAALEKTVASIRKRKSDYHQYLVIDGNSTDGTVAVIKNNLDVIDLWLSEKDEGIYDAMNKAVGMIDNQAGHVLFLGAGDELCDLPSEFELGDHAVCYGDVLIDGHCFRSSANWMLRYGNTLHHQGLFISTELLSTLKFNTCFPVYADFDFNQRLFKRGVSFNRLNKIIATAESGGISWRASQSETARICAQNYGHLARAVALVWILYRKLKIRFGLSQF